MWISSSQLYNVYFHQGGVIWTGEITASLKNTTKFQVTIKKGGDMQRPSSMQDKRVLV